MCVLIKVKHTVCQLGQIWEILITFKKATKFLFLSEFWAVKKNSSLSHFWKILGT